jgi:uncharacterized protein involved in type VI secretion and phage assembly
MRTANGVPRRNGETGAANYTQARRLMEEFTQLGADALLLTGFTGQEGVSRLFSFRLDVLAENRRDVPFD